MKTALALSLMIGTSAFGADSLLTCSATQSEPLLPKIDTARILSYPAAANQALRKFVETPVLNATALKGKRIAVLCTDGVEEIELTIPVNYLKAMGATVDLVAPHEPEWASFGVVNPTMRKTHILTVNLMQNAGWYKIDRYLPDVTAAEYDAFVVPGGAWNPDILRMDQDALALLKAADASGKVVAAVCHGPQVFISAGLLKGRKATSWWACHADLANAGATVLNQPVVIDGQMITSRSPLDLPDFAMAIAELLQK